MEWTAWTHCTLCGKDIPVEEARVCIMQDEDVTCCAECAGEEP
jgi:hypothetical protein